MEAQDDKNGEVTLYKRLKAGSHEQSNDKSNMPRKQLDAAHDTSAKGLSSLPQKPRSPAQSFIQASAMSHGLPAKPKASGG